MLSTDPEYKDRPWKNKSSKKENNHQTIRTVFCKSVLNFGEADVADGEEDGLLDGDTTLTFLMRENNYQNNFRTCWRG